jgi:Fe-S-cluster containining protein
MRAVLRGEAVADVPCDGCVGCCVSAYPIPLRPDDRAALARVPDQHLQLPVAPGQLARMTPRADGRCPMLEADRCTIYADRPRTCRDYDCRLYAAAGFEPDGHRPVIQQRVREWRFAFAGARERRQAEALRLAAQFIRSHAPLFPPSARAHSATAAAVLAVQAWELFMEGEPAEAAMQPEALVQRILAAARASDAPGEAGS